MAPQQQRKGAKKRKKEAKLLKKAVARAAPSEQLAGTKKKLAMRKAQVDTAELSRFEQSRRYKLYSKDYANKVRKLHSPTWKKNLDIMTGSIGSTDRSKLERAEKAATDVLNDILRVDKEMFLRATHMRRSNYRGESRIYFPREEMLAFFSRGMARVELGAMKNLQGAFDDFTEALSLIEHQKGAMGVYFAKEANFLYLRAVAQGKMHSISKDLIQLDRAIQDFRACLAATRTTDDKNGFLYTIPDVHDRLLVWMATKKHLSGTKRPHYSHEESTKIQKELRVNLCSPEKYICGHCGKDNSEVPLHLCARCECTWYCGTDCQRSSWKTGGHKESCSKKTLFFSESDKYLVEMAFCFRKVVMTVEDDNGHLRLLDDGDSRQLRAILQDPLSGGYYDSLSNSDVVFLSLESESKDDQQLKEGFKKMIEELAAVLQIAETFHDGTECD